TLCSCATLQGEVPIKPHDSMPELAWETPQGQSVGLFVPGTMRALTADNRAYRSGDILTVTLQEATQASNRSNTQISKQSGIE
ncbi:flagellar basal body L-ring protein FlgH, partial [Colwellia marinimaniae]|uniref:flagellar basal body L-ring protein FlgH n=1 Tax=Colwellia marinimaniae TaxID=1513592 RepID=UPI00190EC14D